MPRSRTFTSEYKDNLKVNNLSSNNCKVNNLEVYDTTEKEHRNVIDIALDEVDQNFGIPGIIRGKNNKYIRQIVTPNDLGPSYHHIYKHVINDALLYNISLHNSMGKELTFQSLNIINIRYSSLNESFNSSYNYLDYKDQYYNSSQHIQYIDIIGDFQSLEYGILHWTKYNEFIPQIGAPIALNNYIQFIYNQNNDQFTTDNQYYFIKNCNNAIRFHVNKFSNKLGNYLDAICTSDFVTIKIEENNVIINPSVNGIHNVDVYYKNTVKNIENSFIDTIRFEVVDDIFITQSPRSDFWLNNSENSINRFMVYNDYNSDVYIHEFDAPDYGYKCVKTITPRNFELFYSIPNTYGYSNFGYSYTSNQIQISSLAK